MNVTDFCILAEVTPESAGRATGMIFVWVLLGAGALKCWSISRRPTTNAKSAISLMLVLIGWLLASIIGSAIRMVDLPIAFRALISMAGLAALALWIAAIVLAIVGLNEMAARPGVYTQGRAQSIWSIVLSGIVTVIFATGFLRTASQGFASTRVNRSGSVMKFDDLNFQFRNPGGPWMPFETTNLMSISKAGLMRRFPEIYFFVIPEKLGASVDLSTRGLVDLTKSQLASAAESVRVLREDPLKINGLDGILVESEARVQIHNIFYSKWCCATNGYAYQLVAYGPAVSKDKIHRESQILFTNFSLIDSKRIASLGRAFTNDFNSRSYGYSVQVSNSAWHTFQNASVTVPDAEFAASQGDSCLVVIPVWLGGEAVDAEALASGLLTTFQIPYPDDHLVNRKVLDEGNVHGLQFDFSRTIEKNQFRYRFQLVQAGGVGYLVGAWTQRSSDSDRGILADSIQRIKITGPAQGKVSAQTPFAAQERKTQGIVLNSAGLYHFNGGEFDRALPLFKAANRADSRDVYALNVLLAFRALDRTADALAFLETQSATVMASQKVRAQQAFFQSKTPVLADHALTNYAGLFDSGYRNDRHLAEYLTLLNRGEQHDRALEVIEKYLKTDDTVFVRQLEAEEYRLKKDVSKAMALLKTLRERVPFDVGVAQDLANAQMDAGQFSEALETARQMVRAHNDSAFTHYYKGRAELGLKWYREAKTSFETASKLAPADKQIRSYLDYVSGMLGEGNNSVLKDPIDPVPLPPELTNNPSQQASANFGKGHGAYYVHRIFALSCQTAKEFKTTDYSLVRILDESGVTSFSSVQMPFDPLREEIYLNEVRVMDDAGNTISTGNVSSCYVLDKASWSDTASQGKVLNIPIPGLRPGCQLAVTVTRRETGTREFPFLEHYFSSTLPVREAVVFVQGDTAGLTFKASPEVTSTALPAGRCWRVMEPIVGRPEPDQPPAATFVPTLCINDSTVRWPSLVSNYLASISDRLEPDPKINEQALKWISGIDSQEAKVAALSRQVQSNLTYKAIEFGRRARVPNFTGEILRNRYGDCKDHALLLRQMLQAAGVPAHLALVSHKSLVRQDMPSLDQFDHMIVYVPSLERFIDCTSKGSDVAHSIPFGQAERNALILDAANPRFVSIPPYGPDATGIDLIQQVKIGEHGEASVDETLTLTGIHAAFMRGYLMSLSPTSRKASIQHSMDMADVEMSTFLAEGLQTPETALCLHCTYLLPNQFHRVNDQLTGSLKAGLARTYLKTEPAENRLTPFELRLPIHFQSHISIQPPAGCRVETAAADTKLDPRFVAAHQRIEPIAASLNVTTEYQQSTGKFKPADYAAFRETMSRILQLVERDITVKTNRPN